MSDFVNDTSEINKLNDKLQGKDPATTIASVANKLNIQYGGKTPKKVYGEIVVRISSHTVNTDLSKARSDLLVTLNGARDALGGPKKQNPEWTKRTFKHPKKEQETSRTDFETASDACPVSKGEIDFLIV